MVPSSSRVVSGNRKATRLSIIWANLSPLIVGLECLKVFRISPRIVSGIFGDEILSRIFSSWRMGSASIVPWPGLDRDDDPRLFVLGPELKGKGLDGCGIVGGDDSGPFGEDVKQPFPNIVEISGHPPSSFSGGSWVDRDRDPVGWRAEGFDIGGGYPLAVQFGQGGGDPGDIFRREVDFPPVGSPNSVGGNRDRQPKNNRGDYGPHSPRISLIFWSVSSPRMVKVR